MQGLSILELLVPVEVTHLAGLLVNNPPRHGDSGGLSHASDLSNCSNKGHRRHVGGLVAVASTFGTGRSGNVAADTNEQSKRKECLT